jgi:hypothetical protein
MESAVLCIRLWQTLRTEGPCSYHIWRIQHLKHLKMDKMLKYCRWLTAQPTTFYSVIKQLYQRYNPQYQNLRFVSS